MQYQLVIQFSETLEGGFERLIAIEDEFDAKLGADAEIDGHDIGSGQMNIYIITSKPLVTFNKVKNILTSSKDALDDMKAGYRNIEGNDFICIYPEGLTKFKII